MATYTWTIPTGNIINGSTYIKDTDNKIQDTIDDLADFVNSSGSYANQGLMFDYVNKASNQTITGVKTFSNGIVSNVTGNLTGNSDTTTKLATARTITLAGDVTGSLSFDGSANTSMTATIADNSHSHTIANVTGLQTALDGKLSTSGNAATATTATNAIYATTQTAGTNNTTIATTAFVMANSSNTLADLGVTATAAELNSVDGVTSNIQSQLDSKLHINGTAANANKLIGMNWNWSGQVGQPAWLWGGSDGYNMYVYNPVNFSVNYANSAGVANSVSAATVGTAITGLGVGEVGTYAFLGFTGSASTGQVIAGSSLFYSDQDTRSATSANGSWRIMGIINSIGQTVCLRIA